MRAVLLAFVFVAVCAHGAEEQPLLVREPEGWIDLTPPKDFAGWKRVPLDPFPEKPVWTLSADGKHYSFPCMQESMILFLKEMR